MGLMSGSNLSCIRWLGWDFSLNRFNINPYIIYRKVRFTSSIIFMPFKV
jgi:hypothetical protein